MLCINTSSNIKLPINVLCLSPMLVNERYSNKNPLKIL